MAPSSSAGQEPTNFPPFLVGVSGCSSSGKTTLVVQLMKLLEPILNPSYPETNEEVRRRVWNPVAIFQQDNHFVPKQTCPPTSFTPAGPPDLALIPLGTSDRDGHEHPHARIVAADADCLRACDWVGLETSLSAHYDHLLADADIAEMVEKVLQSVNDDLVPFTTPEVAALLAPVMASIRRQTTENERLGFPGRYFLAVENGKEHQQEKFLACRLCFVEGFLLFAREGESRDGLSMSGEEARKAREAMTRRMNLRLFLPVGRETARHRRFQRRTYRDPPPCIDDPRDSREDGVSRDVSAGYRQKGQLWKAEGYFDDVVWPNYEKYHEYLLQPTKLDADTARSGALVEGIHVRGEEDSDRANTVVWALKCITDELEAQETAAREEWIASQGKATPHPGTNE